MQHFESGRLQWAGQQPTLATRQLWWQLPESGWNAEIYFDDGRPFHHLDLSSGSDHPAHPCPPDTYQGHFQLLGPDEWRCEWKVAGPRKDLLLTSRLTRAISRSPE